MIDFFIVIEMYSKWFECKKCIFFDFSNFFFVKEFFLIELYVILDGFDDLSVDRKRCRIGFKKLVVFNIMSYGVGDLDEDGDEVNGELDFCKVLELFDNVEKLDGEDVFLLGEEDEWGNEDEDNEDVVDVEVVDQYEDELEDDYNVEQYFENDDDDYGDDGGDDGGEGVFQVGGLWVSLG